MSQWICKEIVHELTDKEANLSWGSRPPSKFKCAICNKRFKAGTKVISLFTNNTEDKSISGNPIVCAEHGTVDSCKTQLKEMAKQAEQLSDFIRRRYGLMD